MISKTALVLTGGGARGAYQAGVLLGISEIIPKNCFPFPIICGISAGSINAAFLACSEGSFQDSTQRLRDIWLNLESERIFRQNKLNLMSLGLKALMSTMFNHIFVPKWPESILDNTPLEALLRKQIKSKAIQKRITSGEILAVCFSATDFSSGITTSFFEAHSKIQAWEDRSRIGLETFLTAKHVMASSALPGIFKLVKIDDSYYGDGSTRVDFPLYPAIKLGADRIVAIDMRFDESVSQKRAVREPHYPALGEIIASVLETLFSDSLDQDLRRLELVNELVRSNATKESAKREIPSMLFRPSLKLNNFAEDIFDYLSTPLKKTLNLLGVTRGRSISLVSHLAFEKIYTERLLQLGREDALARKDEFLEFIA